MSSKTTPIDLAQRVAEHLSRTSEPRIPKISDTTNSLSQPTIGEVPMHLRHLYNLLEDLSYNADEVTGKLNAILKNCVQLGDIQEILHGLSYEADVAARDLNTVRELFFQALRNHLSMPDDIGSIELRKDWSVVPHIDGEDELAEMFAVALLGGHCH